MAAGRWLNESVARSRAGSTVISKTLWFNNIQRWFGGGGEGGGEKGVVKREQNAIAEVESVGWLSQNIRGEDNIHIAISGERWKECMFCLG